MTVVHCVGLAPVLCLEYQPVTLSQCRCCKSFY
uniref:Uncharacterized protein n=1 Tax=Arundo donax TaxID=35708 RepID=A0A0A9AY96_ARUDO